MNDDLQDAIAALINPIRMRIYREDTQQHAWQTLPSLWEQLGTSSQWGSQESGTAKFGSRPVISTGVVSLTTEIRDTIAEAADAIRRRTVTKTRVPRCTCGPYRHCPGWKLHITRNTQAEIRAVAASLTEPELITWWTEKLNRWALEARAALQLDPHRPRAARGTKCPDCGEKNTHIERDGEIIKAPALTITWVGPTDHDYHPDTDWKVRAVECRSCGSAWFRGDSLDELIGRMLEANQTQETMVDGIA